MKIIDTHCHLYDERFADDLSEVIEKCKRNGIVCCYENSDSFEAFEKILEHRKRDPVFFRPVLGIHPEFSKKSDAYLEEAYAFIRQHRSEIAAIGEIGLDYHYEKDERTKERQKKVFVDQIRLAKELELPIVIHSRDADLDTYSIVAAEKPKRIDLHCYSGSWEMAKRYLDLPIEFYIGVGGVLTFKNSRVLKEVVSNLPIEHILTETDSPYLAPTPHRGERNDPSYLPLVIEAIASLKGLETTSCAEKLYENAERFYGTHI